MARITVEDCLDNESNRFSLVRLAAARAKQLLEGSSPVTDTKGNRAIVSALREIASGKVRFEDGPPEEEDTLAVTETNSQTPETTTSSTSTSTGESTTTTTTAALDSAAG